VSKATPSKSTFRKTAETFTAGSKTLPQRYFTSVELFAREQERIFGRNWICLGHESEIPKAGAFLVGKVANESLLLVRDQPGTVRGFYNVCRHRGTRLCEESSGQLGGVIQCPYHAWTYALDGRLVGAPHMDNADGFDKTQYSLPSPKLAIWEGFIFVNLDENAAPLAKVFAPLDGKFAHWNLSKLRSAKRIEYDVQANWKLIFQNYNECYHCPPVHPLLSKLSPSDSSENDLFEGPFLGGFMTINRGQSMTMNGRACALPVGEGSGEEQQRVFYYSIFPNLLLSMHPDYVMVHRVLPQSCQRSTLICDWLFHAEAFGRNDFHPEEAIAFWDMTNRQDWRVCELSQQGISSRAYRPGPYSPRESIPAAWDREYLRALETPG